MDYVSLNVAIGGGYNPGGATAPKPVAAKASPAKAG
ncbi:hypothetical protein GGQ67_005067 [Rhizobium metallidurans]|uniref:Uncharacterized protein n=1 Tax=Rhizobium metallidurans TaxID=1265931 RepID=A0A7W6CUF6_9HYPH|nr:hypothetical protein [Rhizobium metallidurans]